MYMYMCVYIYVYICICIYIEVGDTTVCESESCAKSRDTYGHEPCGT